MTDYDAAVAYGHYVLDIGIIAAALGSVGGFCCNAMAGSEVPAFEYGCGYE